MSNGPSHEAIVTALRDMIDLAGFSMDVLYGRDAAVAEAQIAQAKNVLAELEDS